MSMGDRIERALLLARTAARLHPLQIAFRPVHQLRTAALSRSGLLSRALAGDPAASFARPILALGSRSLTSNLPGVSTELQRARDALTGHVEILGQPVDLHPPVTRFHPEGSPKLLRYQLNYLGICRSLAVAARTDGFEQKEAAARLALAHLREFLERVPPGTGDAWEPYVVATRLLNLVVAGELLSPVADADGRAFLEHRLPVHLARHARFLTASLELHLLGNHLFTDGAALFVAGCALHARGAGLWLGLGRTIVERSIVADVLPDGGHAERSPMYAALYLDQLMLVRAAAQASGVDEPEGSSSATYRLAKFLEDIAHPDGDIPLLGDSALGEAPLPADLAGAAGIGPRSLRAALYGICNQRDPLPASPELRLFPETGVAVIRRGDEHLVLDAGPLGTSDQPGHAHADALSFDLSHQGRRFIIDAGAGHYEVDEARAYFRGPFGHNTVSVDGEGADELWSAFRAGSRGAVSSLEVNRAGRFTILRGSVRAFRGWTHERLLIFAPGDLLAAFDRVVEAGQAEVATHLHFSPGTRVELGGSTGEIRTPSSSVSLDRLTGAAWRVHEGEHSPFRGWSSTRMGVFEACPELAITAEKTNQIHFAAWSLRFGAAAAVRRGDGLHTLLLGTEELHVGLGTSGLWWEHRAG